MKKLGVMLRKVLSYVVISAFILSNVGYAMPTVAGAAKASVDNMALRSFLQTGDIGALRADQEAFRTMLQLLTAREYTADQVDIINMWGKSLQDNQLQTAAERVAAVQREINNQLQFDEATGDVRIERNGQLFVEIVNDKVTVGKDVVEGASGKAESEAQEKALVAEALKPENTQAASADQKDKFLGDLTAVLDKAVAAGRIGQDLADDIMAEATRKNLAFMGTVAFDANNYMTGYSTADTNYVSADLTDITDQGLHETLEGMGYNDAQVLDIQMKIHGITDRKDTNNPMGQTREAITQSVEKKLTEKETAAQNPAQDVKAEADVEKIEAGDMTEVKRVIETVRPGLSSEAQQALDTMGDEQQLAFVQQTIDMVRKPTLEALSKAINLLIRNLDDGKYALNVKTADVTPALAEHISKGGAAGFHVDDLFKIENKVAVPRNQESLHFLLGLARIALKPGAIQFYGAGRNAKKIERVLKTLSPELAKVTVHAGKENAIADTMTDKSLLRVIYSDEQQIQGIEGVMYFKVNQLKDGQVDLFELLLTVTTGKNLDASQKAVLDQLKGGTIELTKVELIDNAAYKAMQEDYEKVVNLLIQA
ncbi:MAG: hypothetical protein KKB82_01630 [Candidatus Omnitrophica bacterium]|nr:hypothetical protein [Candidatus Omnitrophota bacterium]MBU1924605.1 hypothetical protein [Candidatus Omnitrophota bacterium]